MILQIVFIYRTVFLVIIQSISNATGIFLWDEKKNGIGDKIIKCD